MEYLLETLPIMITLIGFVLIGALFVWLVERL